MTVEEVYLGDKDPEDAWDDGDTDEFKLHVLERVVEQLRERPDERNEARRVDALRLAAKLVVAGAMSRRLDSVITELERSE